MSLLKWFVYGGEHIVFRNLKRVLLLTNPEKWVLYHKVPKNVLLVFMNKSYENPEIGKLLVSSPHASARMSKALFMGGASRLPL